MFKKENWTLKNIAFFFILICAIAVSIWGISALLITAGAPMVVAYAGALVFDALGLWLGHEAIEVAISEESATGHELITYLVVGASMYLNWLHADLAGMTHNLPYVMALFPLAAGILFHFYLKRQSKKARREQNRLVNRNPVLGRMTWIRYPLESFKVWSKSVKANLARANTQIPTYNSPEIENPINVGPAVVGEPIEEKKEIVELPIEPKAIEDKPAKVKKVTTAWTPEEEPENMNEFYRICVEEGVGPTKALPYALTIDPTTNEERVKKGLQRTRKALANS